MFWTIFWPVLAVAVIIEFFHYGMGYFFARQQAREAEKFQKEMEAKGIDPMAGMFNAMGLPPVPTDGTAPEVPKADGGPDSGTGQYL